jgi:hypothetical protein
MLRADRPSKKPKKSNKAKHLMAKEDERVSQKTRNPKKNKKFDWRDLLMEEEENYFLQDN